jgi:hypothetical protein
MGEYQENRIRSGYQALSYVPPSEKGRREKSKKAIQLTQKKKEKKRGKHQWLTKPTILDRCETEDNAQRHNTRPKLAKAVEKTMNQECLDATSKGNLGN